MNDFNIFIKHVSETSVMLHLGDVIDVTLPSLVGRITRRILDECVHVCELTPSYTTILIEAHAMVEDMDVLCEEVLAIAMYEIERVEVHGDGVVSVGKLIELPVYYHEEVGADLGAVAEYSGLSVEQVIELHSAKEYVVCAVGFAPGFAFLADVDERIAMPRRDRPVARVVVGSVGIAERQTAVYPCDTPGGWRIIGNCPVSLFDPMADPASPFEVADRVRFSPIDRKAFLQLGGHV